MKRKDCFPDVSEEIKMEILPKIPAYFPDIPEDILMEILSKIPAYFLWENFRCISKAWYGIISSSSFFYKHNTVHQKSVGILIQVRPFCVKFNTYFLEIAENEFDLKISKFGQIHMGFILSSYNGLILENVFDPKKVSSSGLHVKNYLTGFDITIPNCLSGCIHIPSVCLLKQGFNPNTNEYKLVHFVYKSWFVWFGHTHERTRYEFELFTIGVDKSWRTIPGSWNLDRRHSKVVVVGGRFLHWLCNEDYINSMDIWDETFSKTKLPCPHICDMIEIDGKLAAVDSSSKTKFKIWVLKDFSTGVWSNEHTIRAQYTNYITLKGHVGSYLPLFCDLQAVATLNNGEKILFRHMYLESHNMVYLYDIKRREMREFNIKQKSEKLFIPHHISLVSL